MDISTVVSYTIHWPNGLETSDKQTTVFSLNWQYWQISSWGSRVKSRLKQKKTAVIANWEWSWTVVAMVVRDVHHVSQNRLLIMIPKSDKMTQYRLHSHLSLNFRTLIRTKSIVWKSGLPYRTASGILRSNATMSSAPNPLAKKMNCQMACPRVHNVVCQLFLANT